MSINKTRGWLYFIAKALGDVQAVNKAARKKDVKPLSDRVLRRSAGKVSGNILGSIFR